jgi:hypothetical protein
VARRGRIAAVLHAFDRSSAQSSHVVASSGSLEAVWDNRGQVSARSPVRGRMRREWRNKLAPQLYRIPKYCFSEPQGLGEGAR